MRSIGLDSGIPAHHHTVAKYISMHGRIDNRTMYPDENIRDIIS